MAEAVAAAQRADVVVMCMGLTPRIEGEAGDAFNSESAGDKRGLELPGLQSQLIERVVATGKPVVLVLISGSALAPVWADEHVQAVLQAWYAGAEGGQALAEILFGDVNPSGRLPVTFYRRTADLPPFEDYAMANRTYRFFTGEVLYPFGYGLSYTRFAYRDLQVTVAADVDVRVTVQNSGTRAGDEIVQAYVTDEVSAHRTPQRQLAAFERVHLGAGESRVVPLRISRDWLRVTDASGRRFVEPGLFTVSVGGSQPDARSAALTGVQPLAAPFEIRAG
ncbi:MAG: glycoside hydrolase family 3 C-terminal domain-containing protein [Lentisphaerae bacterium]|nr:glycoside hydrolase family 3 C-terminal domain-containing protein [Lentisphaerota bacterium]